jgi:hypothetical protein
LKLGARGKSSGGLGPAKEAALRGFGAVVLVGVQRLEDAGIGWEAEEVARNRAPGVELEGGETGEFMAGALDGGGSEELKPAHRRGDAGGGAIGVESSVDEEQVQHGGSAARRLS